MFWSRIDPVAAVAALVALAALAALGVFVHLYRRARAECREAAARADRTGAQLTEHVRLLQVISDSLPTLVSYLDAQGVYRFCSKSYETWFGLTREQMEGHPAREVLGDAAYAKIKPRLDQALAGEVVTFETTLD